MSLTSYVHISQTKYGLVWWLSALLSPLYLLIPNAVQVGRDELVRVLDHVDEDLDLRLDLVQVCRNWAEQELDVLLVILVR